MGQCFTSCMKSKRSVPDPENYLALKSKEVALLTGSWQPIRSQDDFANLFLTWYLMTPTNHLLPANLTEFVNLPPEELASNEKFVATAKRVFRDFDRLMTALEHPQDLKTVVDSITTSYITQGLTDADFQNLSFSLVSYLKGVGALSPLAVFAWTQAVNKISMYMWETMQAHHTPGPTMPFKITS